MAVAGGGHHLGEARDSELRAHPRSLLRRHTVSVSPTATDEHAAHRSPSLTLLSMERMVKMRGNSFAYLPTPISMETCWAVTTRKLRK